MRWSLHTACPEFGIARPTLEKRLKGEGIEPGKDKKYSTRDICQAKYGDLEGEKLRLTRESADKLAIENAESRGELIPVTELATALNRALSSIRARILACAGMEIEDRDKLLLEVRELWIAAFKSPPPPPN